MTIPAIADATTRALVDEDVTGLVALGSAVVAADGGLPLAATEGFLHARFLGTARSVGAFAGEDLVAAASVRPTGDGSAGIALVHPDWRGRGLGSALLDWILATPGTVRVETESLTPAAEALLTTRGLRETFAEEVMRRDLTAPESWPDPPPGITLTPWHLDLASRFFHVYRASFRGRPGFPDWSQGDWVDWHVRDEDFAPEWTLLATTATGRDVGFVACARGAWVVQVGVVPEARGGGLGAALTASALRLMRTAGEASVLLDVNVNNLGAVRVYERLGFIHIGRRARFQAAGTQRPDGDAGVGRIDSDEWPKLRELRLEALKDSSMAFVEQFHESATQSDEFWRARAVRGARSETSATFVARAGDRLVGMAACFIEDEVTDHVSAHVVGVYVTPAWRGRDRLAERLLAAAVDWARTVRADRIRLFVTDTNARALAFYRRIGFGPTGLTIPYPHDPTILEHELVYAPAG